MVVLIFCIKINIKGRKRLRFPFWMNVIRNNTHLIKMQDSLISAKVFFSHIWTLSYGRVGNPLFRCTFVDIAVSQSECRVLWSALSSELGNGSLFYIKISIKERKKMRLPFWIQVVRHSNQLLRLQNSSINNTSWIDG